MKNLRYSAFDVFLIIFLAILGSIIAYPFIYTISISISDPSEVVRQKVLLFPHGFDLKAYEQVLRSPRIWIAYKNTVLYTIVGTVFRVILLVMTAYPLSRKKFTGRNIFMFIIAFTMLFSGGLIPTFLVVRGLGLVNTIWAMVLPGALTAYYVIITRTFFQNTIPASVEESAMLDGANDMQILWRIVVPVSTPIIVVMGLFIAVGIWNNFFQPLLYLNDKKLMPLTILLRDIVVRATGDEFTRRPGMAILDIPTQSIQAATLIISMITIMAVYPFIQKYFVKGIMIGAIKE